MARANLVQNPSFRLGTGGWSATNGSTISIGSGGSFYGEEYLLVTKAARNDSGVQSDYINITPGLNYAFSAYASVPITVPPQEDSGLILKASWYSPLGVFISESASAVVSVSDGDGWVRLTGVDTAPLGAVTARISLTQLAAGRARQTFRADAFLFEQSSYVGGYLDNLVQSLETRLTNAGLSALPLPPIGGLTLDADVTIGDLVLNTVDEYNVVWVCTDINGWWGQSDPDTVDIPRGVDDGSYDVSGRYNARVFTLEGSFLLPDPKLLGAARDRLVAATNLVRRGVWLRTNENPTRAAFVRLNGKPQIETVNARGRTDFSIGLKAADPIRYEWNDEDPDGLHVEKISIAPTYQNLVKNPSFESNSTSVPVFQNYMYNPRALGPTISLGNTIDVDPNTNARAFKYAVGAGVDLIGPRVAERAPVSSGQRWWARAKVRRDTSVYGGRKVSSKLVFRDAGGAIVSSAQAPMAGTPGVQYRWTGTPHRSASERYENGTKRINYASDPQGVARFEWNSYFDPDVAQDSTDTKVGGSSFVTIPRMASTAPTNGFWNVAPGPFNAVRVTASVWMKATKGMTLRAGGRTSSTESQGSHDVPATGDWQRVAVTYDTQANDTQAGIQVYVFRNGGYLPENIMKFNGLLVEITPDAPLAGPATPNSYFDGSFASSGILDQATTDLVAGGNFFRWTGTANDSTSEWYSENDRVVNSVRNPSAEGSAYVALKSAAASTVERAANSATGAGSFSYKTTASSAGLASASLRDLTPAIPGQRFWGRARMQLDANTFGAKKLSAKLVFRDVNGAIIKHFQQPVSGTGAVTRWEGLPYESRSERYENGVRRVNEATDPLALRQGIDAGGQGWEERWYGNTNAGVSRVVRNASDGPLGLSVYQEKRWTTLNANAVSDVGWSHNKPGTGGLAVTPGEKFTVSTMVRSTRTQPEDASANVIGLVWFDASGTQFPGASAYTNGPTAPRLFAGQWTNYSASFTAPANAAYVHIFTQVYLREWTIDDRLAMGALLIERTDTVKPFFYGGTQSAADTVTDQVNFNATNFDVYHRWVGTANESISERYVDTTKRTNYAPNQDFKSGTTTGFGQNSSTSTGLLANVPASRPGGQGRALYVTGGTGQNEGTYFGMSLGADLAFSPAVLSAWVYIPGGTAGFKVLALAASGKAFYATQPITARDTWVKVSLQTTLDANGNITGYFYDGVSAPNDENGRSFYVDGLMMEPGTTVGETFSGNSPSGAKGNYPAPVDFLVAGDAPIGTAFADLIVSRDPLLQNSTSDVVYSDSLLLATRGGSTPVPYFDGSSVGIFGDSLYRWVNPGQPNLSPSTRIRNNVVTNNMHYNPQGVSVFGYSSANQAAVAPVTDSLLGPTAIRTTFNGSTISDSGVHFSAGFNVPPGKWFATLDIVSPTAMDMKFSPQGGAYHPDFGPIEFSLAAGVTRTITFPFYSNGAFQGTYLLRRSQTISGYFDITNVTISEEPAQFSGNTPSTAVLSTGTTDTAASFVMSAVAPANASTVEIVEYRDPMYNAPAGDVFRTTDLFLTQNNSLTAPEYFDGSTRPSTTDGDLVVGWSGTANDSISTLGYTGARDFTGQDAYVFQSSVWAAQGGNSLRIQSKSATPGKALAELLPGVGTTLTPGTTYTASIITHRETASSQIATLSYLGYKGQNLLLSKQSEIPKAAGEQVVTLTFTVPLGSDTHYLRVYTNETSTGPDLWVDSFILTEGVDVVPYFDGTTENTPDAIYAWSGTPNNSTSFRRPGPVMIGGLSNIGTAEVTATFEIVGPAGAGSTIHNSLTDETITITEELRGASGAATITNKQITNGVVTLTTSEPHGLVVGDRVIVSGAGSPFDAVNETLTVTAVSTLAPYTFNYLREWPDIDISTSAGQVSLANDDVLSIDTYSRSVEYNGTVLGNRSRVETLVDWIKIAPGQNIISFTDKPTQRSVTAKSLTSNRAMLYTSEAHYFTPGEMVFVKLPTLATLAKKSLTSNVATLTTATSHGFSVGDTINVNSAEVANITNKALSSNVATLTTDGSGAYNIGDLIVVNVATTQTITKKAIASGVATITTAVPHGFSVGDSVVITLSTAASVVTKALSANLATIGTSVDHGFSSGDTITVTLPTTTTVVRKYIAGQTVILTSKTPHMYSSGDQVTVSLPTTATLTSNRTMSGAPAYMVTLNTTAAHGFAIGDRVNVQTGLPASAAIGYDGMHIIESIPSATSFTFLYYNQNGSSVNNTAATGTVTNVTNTSINGTYAISSVPSSTEFSYNV